MPPDNRGAKCLVSISNGLASSCSRTSALRCLFNTRFPDCGSTSKDVLWHDERPATVDLHLATAMNMIPGHIRSRYMSESCLRYKRHPNHSQSIPMPYYPPPKGRTPHHNKHIAKHDHLNMRNCRNTYPQYLPIGRCLVLLPFCSTTGQAAEHSCNHTFCSLHMAIGIKGAHCALGLAS